MNGLFVTRPKGETALVQRSQAERRVEQGLILRDMMSQWNAMFITDRPQTKWAEQFRRQQ